MINEQAFVERGVRLQERPREVATLVVGGHFRATYEYEAHRFYATRAGFPPATVEAIISGQQPNGLTEEEGCAYDMAAALCAGGVVPEPIYAQAVRLFGDRSTRDLAYLCGFHAVACVTMNAFDVAGPERP